MWTNVPTSSYCSHNTHARTRNHILKSKSKSTFEHHFESAHWFSRCFLTLHSLFCLCPSSGIETFLFRWLKLKRRAGDLTVTSDFFTLPVVTSGTSCVSSGLLTGYGDCLSVPRFWPCLGIPRLFPHLWPSRMNLSLLILLLGSVQRTCPLATFPLTRLHRRCRGGRISGREDGQSVAEG